MSCGRPHATPCTEIVALLSAYVDGELGAQEYHLISVHITECPPCEQQEQAQRTVKALIVRSATATGAPGAPIALHARIRAQLTFDVASSSDSDPAQ